MKIPDTAADPIKNIPGSNEPYITNPHPGREYLTPFEALDVINNLSAQLMIDRRHRGGEKLKQRTL